MKEGTESPSSLNLIKKSDLKVKRLKYVFINSSSPKHSPFNFTKPCLTRHICLCQCGRRRGLACKAALISSSWARSLGAELETEIPRVPGLAGCVLQEFGVGVAGWSRWRWGELEQGKEPNKAVAVLLRSVSSLAHWSSESGAAAEPICWRPGAFGTAC